jgi:hypothetical protein
LLSQLKIQDCDTEAIVSIDNLNLNHIIISAWVPGHELTASSFKEHKQQQNFEEDNKSTESGWSFASSGWNMVKYGLKYLVGQNLKQKETTPSFTTNDADETEDVKCVEPLEGCSAIIMLRAYNFISIVADPLREKPLISASKCIRNGYHPQSDSCNISIDKSSLEGKK